MSDTLRQRILQAQDAKSVTVEVPEWSCSLQIRSLTNRGRIDWEVACSKKRKGKVTMDPYRMKSQLVIMTCYDAATGEQVFTDVDLDALCDKSAAVVDRLFEAAASLCGITEQDEDDILGK